MKQVIIILFLIISFSSIGQICVSPGEAQIDLNVNNINARLLNSGDLWWDGADGKYITPSDGIEDVSAIFTGALWIGGVDSNGALKLAAQTYSRALGETDFYPGPLTDDSGQAFENGCTNWDRFWVVNKSEVDAHFLDYSDGYISSKIENIYGWPGRNNPHFQSIAGFTIPTDQKLAPFYDNDQDGNYDPDMGDYPLIKGDQSIWWIFNDNAGPHNVSYAPSLQIEVQAMAYAFAIGNNEDLNNTTFYDFKLTNKATDLLNNGFIGLWVEFDLGCAEDDYMGYDEEYQMMYVYNTDSYDGDQNGNCSPPFSNSYGENIPILGIKKLDSNVSPVTSHVIVDRSFTPTEIPSEANGFYNNLKGVWKDGTPMTVGGSGFDPTSTDTTKFAFNGDPSDENEWSMCSANLPFKDNKSIMSSAMPDLQPGQSTSASYAVIYVNDISYPCPSLDRLKDAADAVCEAVLNSNEELISKMNFTVSPNPTTNIIKITSENSIQSINVIDLSGQTILTNKCNNNRVRVLDISSLPSSIYFISITDDRGNVAIEKVVKN